MDVKPWPSALNPCTNKEHISKGKAPCWGVHGRVTKLCVYCVVEREEEYKGNRTKALSTFLPDPTGNPAL